jgi:ribonuclease E
MSNNKMLIDATHPEETRVVVLRGGRVEEFDYESAARKLLRGNIYLAKVTRVEPSLQAAFVDYGGHRHGFLAFNEIHPDYYQIPIADRQALLEEEAAAEAAEEAAADAAAEQRAEPSEAAEQPPVDGSEPQRPESIAPAVEAPPGDAEPVVSQPRPEPEALALAVASKAVDVRVVSNDIPRPDEDALAVPAEAPAEAKAHVDMTDAPRPVGLVEDVGVQEVESIDGGDGAEAEQVESVGTEDALEELPSRPRRRQRAYKIQEVIKRRQIILVQVVKEERGNKGAALTTYLSLAGRYTVLMPNTARGGGISRKITNAQDRKRLKAIANDLEVPEGMGLIIRTAGAARTKQEIKRDFEYLLRLWENVRELTLQSTAPSLVYEEGNLIKRSIRDLYSKDVDEIVVAGEAAYKEARDFMRMLMPSHVKNVARYEDPEPLFNRFQIERQLNAMFSPYVHLRSGGYLVINQTEALVAIDVNSGKATREFSIEETALNTNLEAADEIARQLRLRDLAGLIVIDFIDMEEKRNNRAVERRLKEALRFDRARIQVGRISHFGLLEMSRQRLRAGVLEGSTSQCPHCQGTGIIRSTESVALAVIRGLEDALMSGPPVSLVAKTTANVALYILNNKRSFITEIEQRYGVSIAVLASEKLHGASFTIEKALRPAEAQRRPEKTAVNMDWGFDGDTPEDEEEGLGREPEGEAPPSEGESRRSHRRRRRRSRRSDQPEGEGDGWEHPSFAQEPTLESSDTGAFEPNGRQQDVESSGEVAGDVMLEGAEPEAPEGGPPFERAHERAMESEGRRPRRGRRRGRRGGRRDREPMPQAALDEGLAPATPQDDLTADQAGEWTGHEPQPGVVERHDDLRGGAEITSAPAAISGRDEQEELKEPEPEPAPERAPPPEQSAIGDEPFSPPSESMRTPRTEPLASEPIIERVVVRPDSGTEPAVEAARPARKGWWQRRFGSQ